MEIFKNFIVLGASLYSAYTDYKYYKIKNYVTVPVALLGIILSLFDKNLSVGEAVLGFLLPFACCFVFYIAKMLRAGDIKLFMALGAVMGYKQIVNCMAASVLAGGVIAVLVVIKRKCFLKRIKKLFEYFINFIKSGVFVIYADEENDSDGLFPFAVSIFCGVVITVFLKINNIYLFVGG